MKKASENDDGNAWLRRCFEYEATHEIAFASPRALLEAGLIAGMDKARASRSRVPRKRATAQAARKNECSELITAAEPIFRSMNITEDIRKYAAEQGIAEEEAPANGMAERRRSLWRREATFTRRREK